MKAQSNTSRNLIVCPGVGDPGHPKYAPVYSLIEALAIRSGYGECDTSLRWRGHLSNGGDETLTLDQAVAATGERFKEYDRLGIPFDCLGRSLGCWAALLASLKHKPIMLNRIILWGPTVYWKVWESLSLTLSETVATALSKGARINQLLFSSFIPIEWLLPQTIYPTRLAWGDKDTLLSSGWVSYVRNDLCQNNKQIEFSRAVSGAPHEVTIELPDSIVEAYRIALFGTSRADQ